MWIHLVPFRVARGLGTSQSSRWSLNSIFYSSNWNSLEEEHWDLLKQNAIKIKLLGDWWIMRYLETLLLSNIVRNLWKLIKDSCLNNKYTLRLLWLEQINNIIEREKHTHFIQKLPNSLLCKKSYISYVLTSFHNSLSNLYIMTSKKTK